MSLIFIYLFFNKNIIVEGGHDSKEDALACLDLMKLKVKEEVKKLQKKARLQAQHS